MAVGSFTLIKGSAWEGGTEGGRGVDKPERAKRNVQYSVRNKKTETKAKANQPAQKRGTGEGRERKEVGFRRRCLWPKPVALPPTCVVLYPMREEREGGDRVEEKRKRKRGEGAKLVWLAAIGEESWCLLCSLHIPHYAAPGCVCAAKDGGGKGSIAG